MHPHKILEGSSRTNTEDVKVVERDELPFDINAFFLRRDSNNQIEVLNIFSKMTRSCGTQNSLGVTRDSIRQAQVTNEKEDSMQHM